MRPTLPTAKDDSDGGGRIPVKLTRQGSTLSPEGLDPAVE